jgi:hypothetical protein
MHPLRHTQWATQSETTLFSARLDLPDRSLSHIDFAFSALPEDCMRDQTKGGPMRTSNLIAAAALAGALSLGALPQARAVDRDIDCKLHYSLTGWSLVYKHTTGRGTVTCNNGASMPVHVSAKAVGLTAGKWHIDHGIGRFSDVHDIHEVLGRYVEASANAGVVKSAEGQVLSKGPVQLALAGGGEGVNLGVDIGAFRITR